jgi:hypothetical protein
MCRVKPESVGFTLHVKTFADFFSKQNRVIPTRYHSQKTEQSVVHLNKKRNAHGNGHSIFKMPCQQWMKNCNG